MRKVPIWGLWVVRLFQKQKKCFWKKNEGMHVTKQKWNSIFGEETNKQVRERTSWYKFITDILFIFFPFWWQFTASLCYTTEQLTREESALWFSARTKLTTAFLSTGEEGKPNIEVIILVCTGAAATFLWIMLIMFIRKLRKVRNFLKTAFLWNP